MRPIEHSDAIKCDYRDYGCKEISCPLNIGYMPQKAFFAISDIPDERCLITIDMMTDEAIDVSIRLWMKWTIENKKLMPLPFKLTELFDREATEKFPPTRPLCTIRDI